MVGMERGYFEFFIKMKMISSMTLRGKAKHNFKRTK